MIIKQISSLEKIFPKDEFKAKEICSASCLKGEFYSFQIAVFRKKGEREYTKFQIESDFEDTSAYSVKFLPSTFAYYEDRHDDNYLKLESTLYPDLLNPVTDTFETVAGQWRCLWVTVKTKEAGTQTVKVTIEGVTKTFTINVIDAILPKQELIFTQWFHCDCLASYYNVDVFSEEHWRIMENFIANAAKFGMNMLLTPVLTPPLDTEIGGERPTVQLVDIEVVDGAYKYSYEKLHRYIKMSQKVGMEYFEISHPFTQWGARFAPKVVAKVDGEVKQIFGWDTIATSEEYSSFIYDFVENLIKELKTLNIFEKCYFHISDEPSEDDIDIYAAAFNILAPLYKECNLMDALSSYEFYKNGLVTNPIPASDHIEPFLENNVPDLWTYYCCGQCVDVSNRFFSMPSARNRILGTQLFKFNIAGFLHWGHNFYYTQYSKKAINPYAITDAGEAFPSGDAFSVYPGDGGVPHPALRQIVFMEALQDLRAMNLLASLTSKEEVVKIMEDMAQMDITFKKYPHEADFILNFREKINEKIAELI